MKSVLKEVVSRKERPFWETLIIIIASVISINYLITLSNLLGRKLATIVSLGILLLSVLLCALVVIRLSTYYTYTLVDDDLVFQKTSGKKTIIIFRIKLGEIDFIKPYSEVEVDKNVDFTYRLICNRERSKLYIGEFQREEKRYRFIFKPSDRLITIINSRMNKETAQVSI